MTYSNLVCIIAANIDEYKVVRDIGLGELSFNFMKIFRKTFFITVMILFCLIYADHGYCLAADFHYNSLRKPLMNSSGIPGDNYRFEDALNLLSSSRLVPSHKIKEDWVIDKITKSRIEAQVKFYFEKRVIGEATLQIDRVAASIMTCWFKSYEEGQRIGREFASRIYLRAYQMGKWAGFDTGYAHMYFYLSLTEEREAEVGGKNPFKSSKNIKKINAVFQALGLRTGKLNGAHQLKVGPYGDMYNQHIAPLNEVVNRINSNWIKWFYSERIEAASGHVHSLNDSDIDNIAILVKRNLEENEIYLRKKYLDYRYRFILKKLSKARQKQFLAGWKGLTDQEKIGFLRGISKFDFNSVLMAMNQAKKSNDINGKNL